MDARTFRIATLVSSCYMQVHFLRKSATKWYAIFSPDHMT